MKAGQDKEGGKSKIKTGERKQEKGAGELKGRHDWGREKERESVSRKSCRLITLD